MKAAEENIAKFCADLGHEIVPVENPVDGVPFMTSFLTDWVSGPSHLVKLARGKGLDPNEVLETWTVGLAKSYDAKSADAFEEALEHFAEVTAATNAFVEGYDVWLTPVLASAPPKLGSRGRTLPSTRFTSAW